MELVPGQIVFSRAGRDVTHPYAVVGVQADRVLLADGGKRPLASPKPKNIRHLNPTKTVLSPDQTGTDQALKAALAAYIQSLGPEKQEGEKLV